MAGILGNRADKAAKKQTMKKLVTLREVILETSKKPCRSAATGELRIDITARKKK